MTKNKPIYYARNLSRLKGIGETSTFHRFTNPRRDKSVYFQSLGAYFCAKFLPVISHRNCLQTKETTDNQNIQFE